MRPGHTYRIYDFDLSPWARGHHDGRPGRHIVFAIDPGCGCFKPHLSVHWRGKNGSPNGYGPKRMPGYKPGHFCWSIRLPKLYRFKRFQRWLYYPTLNRAIKEVEA